jgi:hypothetical protein
VKELTNKGREEETHKWEKEKDGTQIIEIGKNDKRNTRRR